MAEKLHIDREFAGLNPPLSDEELATLEADIAVKKKPREPILFWLEGTKAIVIDGMNRLAICRKHEKDGWTYDTQRMHFKDRQEVKIWIVKNQLGRRNLSTSQKALQAAKLTAMRNGDSGSDATVEEAAEAVGVSARTVEMSRAVLEDGVPELTKAVERGEVSVSAAAAVAELSEAKQRAIVKKGPEAVREVASKQREKQAADREEAKGNGKPKTLLAMFTECDSMFGKVIRMVDQIGRESGDKASRDEVADALDMAYRDFAKWRAKVKKTTKKK